MKALSETGGAISTRLVHTGQHYDHNMSEIFFDQLGIPKPDVNLGVGTATRTRQIADIMSSFEEILLQEPARAVLVVGDVNSTLACALAASSIDVPVVHVEAGLRSFDRNMPEELNRVLTDQISDLLFTTELSGNENLLREGIPAERIKFVGNVMIDSLERFRPLAPPPEKVLGRFGDFEELFGDGGGYGVVTIHRPSNVDDRNRLEEICSSLKRVSENIPLIFPIHPRTRTQLAATGLKKWLSESRVHLVPPLGYLDMLGLLSSARLVITDSGGIQEETTCLGVPCLTVRENTERPVTVSSGTNTIVGLDPDVLVRVALDIVQGRERPGARPEKWDGRAAPRLADELAAWLAEAGL